MITKKALFHFFYSFIFQRKSLSQCGVLLSCFLYSNAVISTPEYRLSEPQSFNSKVDSIRKVLLKAKADTTKAAAYVALTEELYLSNIDTVLPLCSKAIQIIDSKLAKANDIEKKSFLLTKANAINNMGFVYKQQGNIINALELYKKSLKIREDIGDKSGIALSLNNIGLIYFNQGEIPKALEYYNKSLRIQTEIADKKGIARSLNNIGFIHFNQGDIPRALECYNKSLKIREEIDDKEGIATSYLNIGNVYNVQGDFPKALDWFHKSLKIFEDINDKKRIALLLTNIGALYKDQGIAFFQTSTKEEYFIKALEYFNRSLNIQKEIGDKEGIARSFSNIGFIYDKQAEREQNPDSVSSKFKMILEWNLKALKIWEEIGDKKGIASSMFNIGGIYLKQLDSPLEKKNAISLLNRAEEYCKSSLKLAKELNYPEHIRNASERLSSIYKIMGKSADAAGLMSVATERYKQAIEMQELFKLTADKINNVEMQKSILKKQMQLEYEKKDNEAKAEQEKKDDEVKEKQQRQNFLLLLVIVGLVLTLIFAVFVFKSNRQKQKLNVELEKLSIVASETDNGVIICEPNGTLEWMNAAMIRLLGYTLDEWKEQGKTIQEISHNVDIDTKVNKSIASKQTITYESLNIAKDGRKLWIHSTLTPILNKNGEIHKLVVIDTDITERKLTENIIEEKNREITDSIHSAKRIQQALLASDSLLKKSLPEYFVLYKPKDIVSGDFYWANVIDNKFVMITADCTGHGVPGAFMSLLNITYLNEAIVEKRIDSPEKILEYVRSQLINSLNPEGSEIESKDGMDAVLCVYDFKNLWLRFACANNPLWILRNNELIIYKPDKMPVGMHHGEQKPFSINTIGLRKGDIVYTFTDGFADQFGQSAESRAKVNGQQSHLTSSLGQGKKFKYKALKQVLLSIQKKSMEEQKEILNSTFESWRGNLEQVDDVLIIGIRV